MFRPAPPIHSPLPYTARTGAQLTSIEAPLPKLLRQLHKVPLDKVDPVAQALLARLLLRARNLEVVIVQTRNVRVGEARNLARGPTDTAADIEDAHAGLDVGHVGEKVLVAGELVRVSTARSH